MYFSYAPCETVNLSIHSFCSNIPPDQSTNTPSIGDISPSYNFSSYDEQEVVDAPLPELRELYELGTEEEVRQWLDELRQRLAEDPNSLRSLFEEIKESREPKHVGYRECLNGFSLFEAVPSRLPKRGTTLLQGCDVGCTK